MKTLASILSVAALLLVGCAGTDSTIDDNAGDGVEGLKKACGGIAAIKCPKGYECNVTAKYPDAMGTCKKITSCVQNEMCALSSHWDSKVCSCVPNSCVEKVMCTTDSHWDSTLCECVDNVTCMTLECIKGYHCEEKGINGGSIGVCIKN
jgi:hypothetical protein